MYRSEQGLAYGKTIGIRKEMFVVINKYKAWLPSQKRPKEIGKKRVRNRRGCHYTLGIVMFGAVGGGGHRQSGPSDPETCIRAEFGPKQKAQGVSQLGPRPACGWPQI